MTTNISELFENFLEVEGYHYDAINEGFGDSYHIDGSTYIISITIDERDGTFDCMTTHNKRYEVESAKMYGDTSKAYGNKKTFKKPSAAENYVAKWAEA